MVELIYNKLLIGSRLSVLVSYNWA